MVKAFWAGQLSWEAAEDSIILRIYNVSFYIKIACRSDSPLNLHLRIVLSRLMVIIHGSTRVAPSLPFVFRIHSLMAVISCQCASTVPRSSGTSSCDTSYVLSRSPAAVIKYGSPRSVNDRGNIARTATGCAIGLISLTMVSVVFDALKSRTRTVSSAEAVYLRSNIG